MKDIKKYTSSHDPFKEAIKKKMDKDSSSMITDRDQKIWEGVYENIKKEDQQKRRHLISIAVAATIALLLISLPAYFFLSGNQKPANEEVVEIQFDKPEDTLQKTSETESDHKNKEDIAAEQKTKETKESSPVVFNTHRETATNNLSDGSSVTLNKKSSLKTIAHHQRSLQLKEGEVYFEVAHNPDQPFTVKFGDELLRVLGTKFNLLHRPGKYSEVSVMEGRVSVTTKNDTFIIKKGQKLTLNHSKTPELVDINPQHYISWKTGEMDFNQTALSEIALILSRNFDKKIEVAQDIKKCTFSGNFTGKQFDEALNILSLTGNIDIERNKDTITLNGSGCD